MYGTPVIVLADGLIGQMMEPVEFNYVPRKGIPEKTWALTGKGDGERHVVKNLVIDPDDCEQWNHEHFEAYEKILANEKATKLVCSDLKHCGLSLRKRLIR